MTEVLRRVAHESAEAEKLFKHRAILYIGSESYGAPTITVLQGLQRLGFRVYTIGKANINSWFINEVVQDPRKVQVDFVLSNLHWGTAWRHYKDFKLQGLLKVLIDGDDSQGDKTWKDKYRKYCGQYRRCPSREVMMQNLQPYRWMDEIGDYKPDVVFTSQKPFGDGTFYLPLGIQREYLMFQEQKKTGSRTIDFANVPGSGGKPRLELTAFFKDQRLPGRVHNSRVRGQKWCPSGMESLFVYEDNIHSYHRWTCGLAYFQLLNATKVLVYPGVTARFQWDSKRPWEAYASGCLVMLRRPNVDVSQYPVIELNEFAVYDSLLELLEKCEYLYSHQAELDRHRLDAARASKQYFTPVPIARYFLHKVASKEG